MQIIKKLSEMIAEELGDAEKYIKCALNNREEDRDLANLFYTLSQEEMKHMGELHDMVEKKIREAQKAGAEVPVGMKEAYDLIHEMQISHAKEVKVLQEMYRDNIL